MAKYILSKRAAADIAGIAGHSLRQWGELRTEGYMAALKQTFRTLAEFPGIGQDASDIRAGYLRMQIASHIVFYQPADAGIRIVRVLHKRMDPRRHIST